MRVSDAGVSSCSRPRGRRECISLLSPPCAGTDLRASLSLLAEDWKNHNFSREVSLLCWLPYLQGTRRSPRRAQHSFGCAWRGAQPEGCPFSARAAKHGQQDTAGPTGWTQQQELLSSHSPGSSSAPSCDSLLPQQDAGNLLLPNRATTSTSARSKPSLHHSYPKALSFLHSPEITNSSNFAP